MASLSYRDLEAENVALRLLLESAHHFSNHAWSCATVLKTGPSCDCWFGQSAEMLTKEADGSAFAALGDVECKTCGHKTRMHLARFVGQAVPGCCKVDCACMAFVLKTP